MAARQRETAAGRRTLDVGCGGSKTLGATGIDRLALPGVDVVHDLDEFPWPFAADSFDRIVLNNSIEHLEDPLQALVECHRIGRSGAVVHIETPHYSSCDYFTDPTHKHPFSSRSFDYLVPGTRLAAFRYAEQHPYEKVRLRLTFMTGLGIADRAAEAIANRWQHAYELRLAWIFPAHQIVADLRIVKPSER